MAAQVTFTRARADLKGESVLLTISEVILWIIYLLLKNVFQPWCVGYIQTAGYTRTGLDVLLQVCCVII